jgi:hypothetical protein
MLSALSLTHLYGESRAGFMNLSVEITLPVKFSREAQTTIIGVTAQDYEELVHHGKGVTFGPITISASIKLQKTMNYRARTTLNVSWEEPTSRLEARTAFLFYLQQRGLPEASVDYYGALFDNALAFDEEGILV